MTTHRTTTHRCPVCRGHGAIVNPVLSVWTEADRDRDPDGFDAMRRGDYDIPCPCCAGAGIATAEEVDDYRQRRDDARLARMEDGDYSTDDGGGDW